jgi:hypothetical protein
MSPLRSPLGKWGYGLRRMWSGIGCRPRADGRANGANPRAGSASQRQENLCILAVFLVVVGGAALLLFTGIVSNPFKGGASVAAIVNGEKISMGDVDQKLEVYKKIYGQSAKTDFNSPEGKTALADMKRQVLNAMIQEKILVTEAAKEKIVISPQEIKEKISGIKKAMNLSDKDFEEFLKGHAMSIANFEKRVEKEALITRLITKGTQEKGLTKDEWVKALNDRAKVEVLMK